MIISKSKGHSDTEFNNMLKNWKNKCINFGVVQELKNRSYYEKPSVKRKRQMSKAKYRQHYLETHEFDENFNKSISDQQENTFDNLTSNII